MGDVFKDFSNNIQVASDQSLRVKVCESSSVVPDTDLIEAVSKGTLKYVLEHVGARSIWQPLKVVWQERGLRLMCKLYF